MTAKPSLKLTVPPQTLERLTFCVTTVPAFEQWVRELPMANVDAVAKSLYRASAELASLKCSLEDRYYMLESLRDPIHFTCLGLARRFLNQPVIVDPQARRFANQCQVLQNQLAMGYKVAVVQAIQSKVAFGPAAEPNGSGWIVPVAILRAVSELTMTLLRACQLYTNPPPRLWLELNQLELLAERTQLAEVKLELESEHDLHGPGPESIRQAYLTAALLATVSPNKLRQRQLGTLYEALNDWAHYADLLSNESDGTYIVNMVQDEPPVYAPAYPFHRTDACRVINTKRLVDAIDDYLGGATDNGLAMPRGMSADLLAHAAASWSKRSQRAFSRTQGDGDIELCVGFTSAHYHIGDGREFDPRGRKGSVDTIKVSRFADLNDTVTLTSRTNDVWAKSFDAGSVKMPENPDIQDPEAIVFETASAESLEPVAAPLSTEKYPIYQLKMVDTSPGGYCVRWREAPPNTLQTGEILLVRENPQQRWSLAAVRWMRHVKDDETLMGMQLIAPVALPVGVRMITKEKGEQVYQRGMLLPAMKVLKQPAMLIVPRMPFHEGQKIQLQQDTTETKAHLARLVNATESFAQYEFKLIESGVAEGPQRGKPAGQEFDFLFDDQ